MTKHLVELALIAVGFLSLVTWALAARAPKPSRYIPPDTGDAP